MRAGERALCKGSGEAPLLLGRGTSTLKAWPVESRKTRRAPWSSHARSALRLEWQRCSAPVPAGTAGPLVQIAVAVADLFVRHYGAATGSSGSQPGSIDPGEKPRRK